VFAFLTCTFCVSSIRDRNSVCPSVPPSVQLSLSVTRVLCAETKRHTIDILIPHERAITNFLTSTVVGGRRPLLPEICAQSDPPPLKNADFDQSAYNV